MIGVTKLRKLITVINSKPEPSEQTVRAAQKRTAEDENGWNGQRFTAQLISQPSLDTTCHMDRIAGNPAQEFAVQAPTARRSDEKKPRQI